MDSLRQMYRWRWSLALLLALGVWLLLTPLPAWACGGGVICVDASANGAGTGLSWTNAYTNLPDALTAAGAGDEIWVAAGVYYPGVAREATFVLKNNVALYGGFAATETLRTERDWEAHVTILSGDIDANDVNTDGNHIAETWNDLVGANAYHVVTGSGRDATAVLDGFTITAGRADGTSNGGGMYNSGGSPSLVNVTFSGNQAYGGGGIYNYEGGNPSLINARFIGNYATNNGGGINNENSSPRLSNAIFSGNRADTAGGGLYNRLGNSSPILHNVLFSGNSAGSSGGGMYGYWWNSPSLTNVTFSGNRASTGGAMLNNSYVSPSLVNVILWGNEATTGPQIHNQNSSGGTLEHTLVQGGCPAGATCTNLLTADPLFVAPIAAGSAPTTTGNYRLQPGSPAINAGNNAAVTALTDLDGNPRIIGSAVDLGAYEVQPLYVDANATGAATGLTWTDAFTTVQDALTAAGAGNEIWVAEGVYYPDEGAGQVDNDRLSTFQLVDGVALYGGFAPQSGADEWGERDWEAHITVLSGDLDGNDGVDTYGVVTDTAAITGTNAYHVVTGSGVTTTVQLDGFTLTAGQADGSNPHNYGGGLIALSSGSPGLVNLRFSGNSARYGGGMVAIGGSPSLANVRFQNNHSISRGGGLFVDAGGNPDLVNVSFIGNQGGLYGGGMVNGSDSRLINVTFIGNQAISLGGGLFSYAGTLSLSNVRFSGNLAGGGGGMYNSGRSTLVNVTFAGNRADVGGGLYNEYDSADLTNAILWGNAALTGTQLYNNAPLNLNYSLIQSDTNAIVNGVEGNLSYGPGIRTCDPLFTAPITATAAPTLTGDYRLRGGSPAINAGNNLSVTALTDLDGNPRIIDGIVDLGAYEWGPLYVDVNATGANNGTSWADAFTTVQDALMAAGAGDAIDTYNGETDATAF